MIKKITNEAINKLVNITNEHKQELLRNTESLINKTHGTLKEDVAIKMFEEKYNTILDTSQIYYKHLVYNTSNYNWYIGGKMDGLYIDIDDSENNYVVELKIE